MTALRRWGAAAVLLALAAAGCDAEPVTRPALPAPAEAQATATAPTPLASDDMPCFDQTRTEDARAALPALTSAPGRIAFVCRGQIWTMRPDGSGQRRVTDPVAVDYSRVRLSREPLERPPTPAEIERFEREMNSNPLWLPDGRIVFASIRDTLALSAAADPARPRPYLGANELYVINADGTGLRRLTDYNLTPGSYPSLYQPGYPAATCPDPTFCPAGRVRLTPLAASPDGSTIVVDVAELRQSECCEYSIFLNVDTGRVERTRFIVANVDPRRLAIVGHTIVAGMSWSPDGARAAITHRDLVLDEPRFDDISVHDLATREQQLLVQGGNGAPWEWLSAPAWSPDGQSIAFCAEERYDQPATLYLVSVSGGAPRPVATLPEPCIAPGGSLNTRFLGPSWSPDSRFLVIGTRQGITVVDPATGASAIISSGAQPVWGNLLNSGK